MMSIADFRLSIVDYLIKDHQKPGSVGSRQSAIGNRQSEIHNRQSSIEKLEGESLWKLLE